MHAFVAAVVALCGLASGWAMALPSLTTGAGSAVATVDRTATFDLVTTGTSLGNYTENGLRIVVDRTAFTGFDPTHGNGGFSGGFHYPRGGTVQFTSISTFDGLRLGAVEFNVGNGYGSATTDVEWRTFRGGVLVGSGATTVASGGVVGLTDGGGFDELLVADRRFQPASDNAIALDNVRAQLLTSSVPEPSLTVQLLAGLGVVVLWLRARARKTHFAAHPLRSAVHRRPV